MNAVSEVQQKRSFFTNEDPSMNYSSPPLYERQSTNSLYMATTEKIESDKAYCCEHQDAVERLNEERSSCCTNISEDGRIYRRNSSCSTYFSSDVFPSTSKLIRQGMLSSEHNVLPVSSDKAPSWDDRGAPLENDAVGLLRMPLEDLQYMQGPLGNYTSAREMAAQSSQEIEKDDPSFIRKHDYAFGSTSMHNIGPGQSSMEEELFDTEEKQYGFISKNIKQLTQKEIKSEIEKALDASENNYRNHSGDLVFITSPEFHIYHILKFCLLFNECEFLGRSYEAKKHKIDTLAYINMKTNVEELLCFLRAFFPGNQVLTRKLSDPYQKIFKTVCSINGSRTISRLNIDSASLDKSLRKTSPSALLFPENFSKGFKEIEMVTRSVNANTLNPRGFFEDAETNHLKFLFQNLKNLDTVSYFCNYDKIEFSFKKTKVLIEYHLQAFFKDHMELKMVLLPEILSLRLSIFQKGYVVHLASKRLYLLILYSLSCLNGFFESLAKSSLDEFVGNLKDKNSRVRLATHVLFLRTFYMTALLRGLRTETYVLWIYNYFSAIEFLFLINDEGCYVSSDESRFNPMNVIFFTFFYLVNGGPKGYNLTVEDLLCMSYMQKSLTKKAESFLYRQFPEIKMSFEEILVFAEKFNISIPRYLMKKERGVVRWFKTESQLLNALKHKIIRGQRNKEKEK